MKFRKFLLTNKKKALILLIILSIISTFTFIKSTDIKIGIAIILLLIIAIYLLLEREIILTKRIILDSKQDIAERTDSYINLYHQLSPIKLLPKIDLWTAAPDYLIRLIEIIEEVKPKYILEAGSGLSTLVAAYTLKRNNFGKIISFEHLDEFQQRTQKMIKQHDLSEYSDIFFTPLKNYRIEENDWLWYDFDNLDLPDLFDLIIIDGPPSNLQRLSRYPMLPLFNKRLGNNCKILMDDGNRDDEKLIATKWADLYKLELEYINNSKGAFILKVKNKNGKI